MNSREQQRVLLFLRELLEFLFDNDGTLELDVILKYYTTDELRSIIYTAPNNTWNPNVLELMPRKELLKRIVSDYYVLQWTIAQLEQQLKS